MQRHLDGAHRLVDDTAPMRGCIHDLRNLFAVVGAAKFLLQRPLDEREQTLVLEALDRVATEGKVLTSALLSGGQVQEPKGLDAAEELRGLEPLVRALVGARTKFLLQIDETAGWIRIARSELESVVLELVSNAKVAGARGIRIRGERRGENYWLVVADDGAGFDRARLQDRPSALGNHGNGLARVASIAQSAHGSLRIRSKPGQGSVMALVLPTAPSPRRTQVEVIAKAA